MNNPPDKKERLYKVNDFDYIDPDDIDGIHIEGEKMTVIYYGLPIPITYKLWQRHICQRYFNKSQLSNIAQILKF